MDQQISHDRLTVLVLRGGPGSEHEVSLASGAEVVKALRAAGHRVIESDIGPEQLDILDNSKFDVVFSAIHGTFGEDGQLQAILEKRCLPLVGSDAASSQLAIDKYQSKQRFEQAGLATPPSVLISVTDAQIHLADALGHAVATVGIPAVVKPNLEGSSVGVYLVQDAGDLEQAVVEITNHYGDCLVEKKISGRELTVGILAETALPVVEIRPAKAFYDYEAKYELDTTEYLFDLDLAAEKIEQIQNDALAAFKLLSCRDFGRADFLLDEAGNHWLLEINTIPGLTTHSLLPKAAQRAGINMSQLCDQIVRIAYERPI